MPLEPQLSPTPPKKAGQVKAPPQPKNQRFSKKLRIRKRREYLRVQKGGRRIFVGAFAVYARESGLRRPRLGITISRKVGKAVERNRIKRWLREAFRKNQWKLRAGLDLVFVARAGHAPLSYAQVEAALLEAHTRAQRSRENPRRSAGGRGSRAGAQRPQNARAQGPKGGA